MTLLRKASAVSMACILAVGLPSAANAAQFLNFDGSDGVFGNNNVASGSFSDSYDFNTAAAMGLLSATISSVSSNTITNIDFTSVTLNGTEFDIVQTGRVEFRDLQDLFVAGGTQTLLVNGTSGGNGSYAGTLAFVESAVPEPATWAFMIFGFGAIGGAMRRQRKANVKVSYA